MTGPNAALWRSGPDSATVNVVQAALDGIQWARRRRSYLGDRPPVEVDGRAAIVIDDGIATGATTRAALPVAPIATLAGLRREVDAIVCLESPEDFDAIGMFYDDFRQVTDQEVTRSLKRAAR